MASCWLIALFALASVLRHDISAAVALLAKSGLATAYIFAVQRSSVELQSPRLPHAMQLCVKSRNAFSEPQMSLVLKTWGLGP